MADVDDILARMLVRYFPRADAAAIADAVAALERIVSNERRRVSAEDAVIADLAGPGRVRDAIERRAATREQTAGQVHG